MENEIQELQEQLKSVAEKMKLYRDEGNYELEMQAHAEYNELITKINDLNKQNEPVEKNPIDEEIKSLQEKLKDVAERMKLYKDEGNYELEMQAHAEYNELITKIEELNKQKAGKENKGDKGDKSHKDDKYQSKLDIYKSALDTYKDEWNKLYELQQQYENGKISYEEYDKHAQYMIKLYNNMMKAYKELKGEHDILKSPENKGKNQKWHPDLTPEQIDYIKSELDIYEPEGQEYEQALRQLGLDPKKQPAREENPFKDLTDEQLQQKSQGLDKEIASLQEQQKDVAERMKLYKDEGNYELEMQAHAEYNELITKIEEMKKIKAELARRKEQGENNNNIEEPEKPTEPMFIQKNKENPPVPPIKPGNNLPARSFWEIYNDTCTEHVGSIPTLIYNMAHMKILPSKDEDAATKILSGITIPFKAILKPLAKIPNAILGTNKKMENIQGNIDSLTPEEFETLVSSPEKLKDLPKEVAEKIRATYDKDYLSPQFMKQHKVPDLYLRAVSGRLQSTRKQSIELVQSYMKEVQDGLADLEEKMRKGSLTPEEQANYIALTETKKELQRNGEGFVEEMKTFDRGAKEKSFGFKNIRGWFLGKFNPDNRDENARMAEMAKSRREAFEKGNIGEVSVYTNMMEKYASQQTHISHGIDRGSYSIEGPIEMLDRGEDTRGKLLLANAAAIASVCDLIGQIRNMNRNEVAIAQNNQEIADAKSAIADHNAKLAADQQKLNGYDQAIKAHNQDIQTANQANSSISVTGTAKLQGAEEATVAYSRIGLQDKFNADERAALDGSGWNMSSSAYKSADATLHQSAGAASKSVQSALSNGDYAKALDELYKYQTANPTNLGATQSYMSTHPQFDYNAVNLNGSADYKTMYDFLTQASKGIQYSDTVSGQMVQQMAGLPTFEALKSALSVTLNGANINQSLNLLPVIMATSNVLYQGTKQGIRDSLKVKPQKQQDNKGQEESQKEKKEPDSKNPSNEEQNNEEQSR